MLSFSVVTSSVLTMQDKTLIPIVRSFFQKILKKNQGEKGKKKKKGLWLFSSILQTKRIQWAPITNNFELLLPFLQFIEVLVEVAAVGFKYPSIISNLSSKAVYTVFCIQAACLEGMRKERALIPIPIREFLQKCTLTTLSYGHRKTRKAPTKEGKAGQLYQAERIFCVVCLGASLKHAAARMSPQVDTSSQCHTAKIPQTSLTLDHASPPWPQPCKITVCCPISSKLKLILNIFLRPPPSVPLSRYCSMKKKKITLYNEEDWQC